MTTLIKLRETTLNLILNTAGSEILNDRPSPESTVNTLKLCADLSEAVKEFKALAIDDRGKRVDYRRLRESQVYRYFCSELTPKLQRVHLSALESRAEGLAFWINLYNALVIDAVISFGIQHRVTEGWLGIVRFFRRAAYNIGGLRFSLEDIEHGVLRANRGHPYSPGAQFATNDPRIDAVVYPVDQRIHFALNCASRSCPPISVYTVEGIDAQLDGATRNFIDHEVRLNEKRGRLEISQIFKWYEADFGGRPGVIDFLLSYLPNGGRRAFLSARGEHTRLAYLPYQWELNI